MDNATDVFQENRFAFKAFKITLFSSKMCTLMILKINACHLSLAISWFGQLSKPCLFTKVYWEGKGQGSSNKRLFSGSPVCTVYLKEVLCIKVADLSAQKLLNDMHQWTPLCTPGKLRIVNLFVFSDVRSFPWGLQNMQFHVVKSIQMRTLPLEGNWIR